MWPKQAQAIEDDNNRAAFVADHACAFSNKVGLIESLSVYLKLGLPLSPD